MPYTLLIVEDPKQRGTRSTGTHPLRYLGPDVDEKTTLESEK
jgi:hypothetical protein